MTQTLEYIRIDSLKNGDLFGLIIQCTLQGEAVNFARGESVGTTIRRLRDLADRLERHTQETFAGQPGFPPETPEQERSMRRDRYPPRFETETPAARPCPVCDTTGGHAWNCSLNQV